jgi:hypothetical protein
MTAAGIEDGRLLRSVSKSGKVNRDTLSDWAVWSVVEQSSKQIGIEHFGAHDLRRTCAKLCRKNGGDLEQIKFLLGHSSIQTTERYLGSEQDIEHRGERQSGALVGPGGCYDWSRWSMKLQVNHRSAEFTEILSIIQAGRAKAFEAVNVALAVGSTSSPLTPEQRKNLLPREVHDAVALYLSGKIDQWYWRQDGKGIVFLMNVSTVEEAQSLLDKLPFGEAKS